jgi:hypothetical protein
VEVLFEAIDVISLMHMFGFVGFEDWLDWFVLGYFEGIADY